MKPQSAPVIREKQKLPVLTPQQKKDFIAKRIQNGDTRSWNEIMADLELEIWTAKMQGLYGA